MNAQTPFTSEPDSRGYWGEFGGRFVAETLMAPLHELEAAFAAARADPAFLSEFRRDLADISGRPTPLTYAERLTAHAGGARIWLKREDLGHTGSHKINNAIGQALLARRMGKTRVIAETGAGQHGVASATVCARFGLQCVVYMGAEDARRQALNVTRMRMLGAEVREVEAGSRTLKDAINEALRDWVGDPDSFYMLGSALGPHPYPLMVREFQRVIGEEAREQFLAREGRLPDLLVACVGGGSNAIGFFHPFLADDVDMLAVEAGGKGDDLGSHAARFHEAGGGAPGVLHGTRTYLLQDEAGQTAGTHSISAGLDYPAVGPEHADLRARGRVRYTWVGDGEALAAFGLLARLEGLIPALESSHAVAAAVTEAPRLGPDKTILVNLSGRGDKDVAEVAGLTS